LKANYCHDRFCVPCTKARSQRIVENLMQVVGDQRLRFITLTLTPDDRSLSERLDFLLQSFTRLRHQARWTRAVLGGAYFVEITRGDAGQHWHVHLHCLVVGSFLPQADLVEMWRKASKGSYIVDIRKVADNRRGVEYLAKYATKAVSHDVVIDPAALTEAVRSLVGRRVLGTFGSWRKIAEIDVSQDYRTYKRVERLDRAMLAAFRGETWAIGALRAIGRPDLIEPVPVSERPPPPS
jgi:hypothetical protein